MQMKKLVAGAATAAALGFAAFGAVSGVAQADPDKPGPPWNPGGHGSDVWLPGDPPGHNPFGPPGQVMQGNPVVPGLTGVPPGHWGDPVRVGLPPTWLPGNWVELGIPGPLPLVWNIEANSWGIWWNDVFISFNP